MRTSALVRIAAVLTTALLSAGLLTTPALADDTPPPVVGPDTVTLYPAQSTEIDVLDNDTSPTGDDLALCRFPDDGIGGMRSVWVLPYGAGPGDLLISVMPKARGMRTIDYFVCDHTHLVPATLTVVIRDVEPVDVTKTDRPGRLQVTNHNPKPIRFWFGHPQGRRTDGRVRIDAGKTTTVRVQRHTIVWIALIGPGSIKGATMSTPAIADFGFVRHIKLDGPALPEPHGVGPDGSIDHARDALARWR